MASPAARLVEFLTTGSHNAQRHSLALSTEHPPIKLLPASQPDVVNDPPTHMTHGRFHSSFLVVENQNNYVLTPTTRDPSLVGDLEGRGSSRSFDHLSFSLGQSPGFICL